MSYRRHISSNRTCRKTTSPVPLAPRKGNMLTYMQARVVRNCNTVSQQSGYRTGWRDGLAVDTQLSIANDS